MSITTRKTYLKSYINKAQKGTTFTKLYELVINPANVKIAFRNIKKNKGSKTSGVNQNTIFNIGLRSPDKLVQYVKNRLEDYKPHKVKRKEIPKPNGGVRTARNTNNRR